MRDRQRPDSAGSSEWRGASGLSRIVERFADAPRHIVFTVCSVFIAVLAGQESVVAVFVASLLLEIVRSFSTLYFPNTWQFALGAFLLLVILFRPGGIGSLWARRKRRGTLRVPPPQPAAASESGGGAE